MRAIIIGAGKIGYNLAKILAKENHDVVVIEKEEERAKIIEEYLDVEVMVGNGASGALLVKAGIKEAGLMIAVTASDEVNMIACMVAKTYGVGKTVARVRNSEYIEEKGQMEKVFPGIDLIINPELVTAKEIVKLIDAPEALGVEYYADGNIQLLELRIKSEAPVVNMYLRELKFDYSFLILAIMRHDKLIIPCGKDQILANDLIFLLAKTKEMVHLEKLFGIKRFKAQRVMVLGGGYTGYHLAKILEGRNYAVKIIEKEYNKCIDMAQNLNNTMVLYGDATDMNFLINEGIGNADIFVCLSDDDKLNLLVSLIVKNLGVKRTIAQVGHSDYVNLIENVGIDVGISPRVLTANEILRFVHKGNNIISVTLLSNESAEMTELIVSEKSQVANRKLRDLHFPDGSLIGSIYRQNQVIIPGGNDELKPGDVVTLFTLPKASGRALDYLTK
jgi:trk system potassium uptake protein TrkA